MTTPQGVAHCVMRLTSCPTLTALLTVWNNIAVAYQRHPEVRGCKDRMKEQFK